MSDELKSNPSPDEVSEDTEPGRDTDQLTYDAAESGPLADADTDKLVDKSTDKTTNGVDKTPSKPAADTSSSHAARAIPSLPITDDSNAKSEMKTESASVEDKDAISNSASDEPNDDKEARSTEPAPRIPFDPPPTQGKRFKQIKIGPDGRPEVVAEEGSESSDTDTNQAKSDVARDAAKEDDAQEASSTGGMVDNATSSEQASDAIPASWLEEASESADTNPLHPSTRQPRRPHNWQLQRNAAENSVDDDFENSDAEAEEADSEADAAPIKDAQESQEGVQNFPVIDLDTSELSGDKPGPSVSGLRAMPGSQASVPFRETSIDQDKTRPPAASTAAHEGEHARSAFTFSMNEEELQNDTAVLSKENRTFQRAINKQEPAEGTSTLGEQREVILVIRGMIERLIITEKKPFSLGRFELGRKQDTEIDLTPYGALDRGVSRVHAQLHLQENHLYITDLGSTNGTYLAGKRLNPNEPTLLRKGDELLVGRLSVQVMFR